MIYELGNAQTFTSNKEKNKECAISFGLLPAI